MVQFGEFWKSKACGQTVLPDRSVLIGQKLVGNAKIEKKIKCDILGDFQTMCRAAHFSVCTLDIQSEDPLLVHTIQDCCIHSKEHLQLHIPVHPEDKSLDQARKKNAFMVNLQIQQSCLAEIQGLFDRERVSHGPISLKIVVLVLATL